MSNEIKFSIIIPSYNQGQFIEETILSIVNQDYNNIEIIVIDGGSKDNTIEILTKLNNHIAYWVSEKDKGTYDANNKGLKKITGDFWMVVNSDDILLPGALHAIAQSINDNPSEKWFAGNVKYIDEFDGITGRNTPQKPTPIAGLSFFYGCWISHPTVCLSRELVDKYGLFESYHLMDLNYWLRLEWAGLTPFLINYDIAGLRLHPDCKSADRLKLFEEYARVVVDFAAKVNISTNKHVITAINSIFSDIERCRLNRYLILKQRTNSFCSLIIILKLMPSSFFKKWFWGATKRFIFGVNSDDLLLKDFVKENNANWNQLD